MSEDLVLKIPITGDTSGIEGAMNTMKSKVSGAMSGVRDAMGAVGIMAAGFLEGAVASAEKGAAATDQLRIKLQDQGISWTKAKVQVDQFTAGVEKMSIYSKGDAKAALDTLITRHVSMSEALKDQTGITELAAAKNITLKEAADQVANAENGRMGGLVKLGVVTKDEVKNGISMEEVNKRLNTSYKGLAEGQMNTLPGQVALITRNFAEFKTGIGTALLPVISVVAKALENISESLKTITPAQKDVLAVVLALTAGLGVLTGGVGIVTKVMSVLGPVVSGLGGLIEGLMLPIVAVIAVITLLTAAFINNWGGIRDKTNEFIAYIKPILINTFNEIVTWFKTNWPMIQQKCEDVFKGIQSVYNTVLKPVINFVMETFKQVVDWTVKNWPLIQKTIQTVMNGISIVIKAVLSVVTFLWDTWGTSIMTVVTTCFNNVKIIISTAIKVVEDIIKAVMQAINGDWSGAWKSLIQAVKDILGGLGGIVMNSLSGLAKIFVDLASQAISWGTNVIEGFINGIMNDIGKVVSAGENIANSIGSTVKKALGIHSPSTVMTEFGEFISQGLANGITNKTDVVVAATTKITDNLITVTNAKVVAAQKEIVMINNQTAAEATAYTTQQYNLQLSGLKKNLQMAKTAADKASIKKQITDAEAQRAKDVAEAKRQAKLTVLGQEVTDYQKQATDLQTIDDAKAKAADDAIKAKAQADADAATQKAKDYTDNYNALLKWIDDKKFYNQLSLADELQCYKTASLQYAAGTAEKENLDKQAYTVQQTINADIDKANTDYASKTQARMAQLYTDIQTVQNTYDTALASKTAAIYSSTGLFDDFTPTATTSATLISNLQDQVDGVDKWQQNITALAQKGISGGLVKELTDMGPAAAGQIQALNDMTSDQLTQYVALWNTKNQQAATAASSQLTGLQATTNTQIQALTASASTDLQSYQVVWQQAMDAVNTTTTSQIGATATAMVPAGASVATNLISGLVSQQQNLASTVTTSVVSAFDSVKDLPNKLNLGGKE